MGKPPRRITTGKEVDITDLEETMRVERGGKFDWDSLCDGSVHWVLIPKDDRANVRTAFRHAGHSRGKRTITRWGGAEHEEQKDSQTWGRMYLQAKHDGD